MTYKPMPSIEELFDRFYVDSTSPTGLRYAKNTRHNTRVAGDPAGCLSGKYIGIRLNGVYYTAHRIIQKMKTGEDLQHMQVDHINLDRRDNHPFNLRWSSTRAQHQNTTACNETGFKGVSFEKRCKTRPFRATIWVNGKHKSLGYFATAEEAHAAYSQELERRL
jgi:hypothetical protein